MKKTIEIPIKEYEELIRDQIILCALEAEGVDNWEGWDIAMEELEKEGTLS